MSEAKAKRRILLQFNMHGQREWLGGKKTVTTTSTLDILGSVAEHKSVSEGKSSFFARVRVRQREGASCQKSCLICRLNYLVFFVDFCASCFFMKFFFFRNDIQFVSIRKDLSFEVEHNTLHTAEKTQKRLRGL